MDSQLTCKLVRFGNSVQGLKVLNAPHPVLLSTISVIVEAMSVPQSSWARLKPSGREVVVGVEPSVPSVKVRVKPLDMSRSRRAATAVGMLALAGGIDHASLPSTRPRINRRMRSANDIGIVPSPSAVRGVVQWRRRIDRHKGTNSSTSLWGVSAVGGMAQPVQSCSKRLNAAEAVASPSSRTMRSSSSAAYSGSICSMCFIFLVMSGYFQNGKCHGFLVSQRAVKPSDPSGERPTAKKSVPVKTLQFGVVVVTFSAVG